MKIVVTDVSVFFDLFIIQALPEFFELELEICTTDFVYSYPMIFSSLPSLRPYPPSQPMSRPGGPVTWKADLAAFYN